MSDQEDFLDLEKIFTKIEQKNRLKSKIMITDTSSEGRPSHFQLVLTGEFKEFQRKFEDIVNNFLRLKDEAVKIRKIEEAILYKTFYSDSYTFEIVETIAIQILEYAEKASLMIDCSIKKDTNFIQM